MIDYRLNNGILEPSDFAVSDPDSSASNSCFRILFIATSKAAALPIPPNPFHAYKIGNTQPFTKSLRQVMIIMPMAVQPLFCWMHRVSFS